MQRTENCSLRVNDDLTHDQAFVKVVIAEMLETLNMKPGETTSISSDNCTSQYKSSQHFHDLQTIATKYNIRIIRIYGVAGHGKNEIDTVGGVVKITLRKAVVHGEFFATASSCVDFLVTKFGENESPEYNIKEIYPEEVEREHNHASKTKYYPLDGSSKFRVWYLTLTWK